MINGISVVIACYKDAESIPVMHNRLKKSLDSLNLKYEIIFVNDGSPDNTIEVLKEITNLDVNVKGVTHTRNFGSQSAFLSGMKISKGDAVVLLDGDLQDPPELIPDFIEKWKLGFEVVYGIRESREAPIYMQFAYKVFYKIFSKLSSFKVPKDAGDFSLMDRKVVDFLLNLKEREPFLRALRAYFGGRSTGVKYRRAERLFGQSNNNLLSNLGWASKGLVAVSRIPLNIVAAVSLIAAPIFFIIGLILLLLNYKNNLQNGISNFVLFLLMILLLIQSAVTAIYLGKIMEDTKQRPLFIVDSIISNGKIIKE